MPGRVSKKLLCDLCHSIIDERSALNIPVDIGETETRIVVCKECLKRSRRAPSKYIKKSYKEEVSGHEDLKDIQCMVSFVRNLISKPEKSDLKHPINIEEVRSKAVEEILSAMAVVEELAKHAPMEAERNKTDTTKARYYNLLGYLVQVLDGVLKSVEANDLDNRLKTVEALLNDFAKAKVKKG
ncbi:MAG: hypothetical protein QXV46_07325 [Candidatus Bathyarchaeia archaeon]